MLKRTAARMKDKQDLLRGRILHAESYFKETIPASYEEVFKEARFMCTEKYSRIALENNVAVSALSLFGKMSHKIWRIIEHVRHLRDFKWAELDRDNLFIDTLTKPEAHSSNEDATLRALSKHAQPDTTSWFLADIVSAHLRGAGVYIEHNLIDSYGPESYWYLTHKGPNKPGYTYRSGLSSTSVLGSRNTDWNVINFDEDRYNSLREGCYR